MSLFKKKKSKDLSFSLPDHKLMLHQNKWRSSKGEDVDIESMALTYLKNAIKMVDDGRHDPISEELMLTMKNELIYRQYTGEA